MTYLSAARTALISANRCTSDADCSAKQLLFWEAGGFALGPVQTGGVGINVYQESSLELAANLEQAFSKIHTFRGKPKVTLTIYRNKHLEKDEILRRIEFK